MNQPITPTPKPCPHCGQPMPASTPAAGPLVTAPLANAAPAKKQNETWHDRPPLL